MINIISFFLHRIAKDTWQDLVKFLNYGNHFNLNTTGAGLTVNDLTATVGADEIKLKNDKAMFVMYKRSIGKIKVSGKEAEFEDVTYHVAYYLYKKD